MDVAEVAQVGVDVQRQAVHRDEVAAADADGAHLAGTGRVAFQPNARGSVHTSRHDAIRGAHADDGFLQRVYVGFQPQMEIFQVEDGVAHQLAGAVVSDVAPAVDVVVRRPDASQLLLAEQHIGFLAAAPQGVDVGMLAQHKARGAHNVSCNGLQGFVKTTPLLFPGVSVRDKPPVFYRQLVHKQLIIFSLSN